MVPLPLPAEGGTRLESMFWYNFKKHPKKGILPARKYMAVEFRCRIWSHVSNSEAKRACDISSTVPFFAKSFFTPPTLALLMRRLTALSLCRIVATNSSGKFISQIQKHRQWTCHTLYVFLLCHIRHHWYKLPSNSWAMTMRFNCVVQHIFTASCNICQTPI